jgi:hypothetical protein
VTGKGLEPAAAAVTMNGAAGLPADTFMSMTRERIHAFHAERRRMAEEWARAQQEISKAVARFLAQHPQWAPR